MGDAYPSLSLSMAPSGFVVGPATKPGHGTAGCSTVSGHAAPGCAVLDESPELARNLNIEPVGVIDLERQDAPVQRVHH